jgi:hypothetical protein
MSLDLHVLRLHLSMQIDEDTHLSTNPSKWVAIGMYLKKTYRRSVVLSECYPRPQEPRRPRFPFFLSSQCQRTDPVFGSRRQRRWKLSFRILRNRTLFRLPGRSAALSVITEQWERLALDVVSAGVFSLDLLACQHPIFNFRKNRNLRPESWNFFFSFRHLLQSLASCGAAVLSGEAGYRGDILCGQQPKMTKSTFSESPGARLWETRAHSVRKPRRSGLSVHRSSAPRIQQFKPDAGEVPGVTGDESEFVAHRSGRDPPIHDWKTPPCPLRLGHQLPPGQGRLAIDQ